MASRVGHQRSEGVQNHFKKSMGGRCWDDAATKLIWLALRNITADWGRAAPNWKEAMNQFAILYEERFTQAALGSKSRP